MIPLKPGQTRPFPVQPRRRIEISAAGKRELFACAAQRNTNNRVDGFAPRRRMIFAHTDYSITLAIDHAVGVTHFDFRCDRLRIPGVAETIQPLISEVREIDQAIARRKTSAAVFMDSRTSVEWNRREVNRPAARREFNNHIAAFFLWSGLYPVDVIAVYRDLS